MLICLRNIFSFWFKHSTTGLYKQYSGTEIHLNLEITWTYSSSSGFDLHASAGVSSTSVGPSPGHWLAAHRTELNLGKTAICIFVARFYGRMPFLSPTRTLSAVQDLCLCPTDFCCMLYCWHHESVVLFRWTTATAPGSCIRIKQSNLPIL